MGRRRPSYELEPHEIPCGEGCRLVVALTKEGTWQAVYYQRRYEGDPIGERFAIEKTILLDAIRVLFAEADEPFDADLVIDYIGSTTWGARAPRLTSRRRPYPMPQDQTLSEEFGEPIEKGAP